MSNVKGPVRVIAICAITVIAFTSMHYAQAPALPIGAGAVGVEQTTSVDLGNAASAFILLAGAVLVPVIGVLAVGLLSKALKKAGFDMTDAMHDRLQKLIVDGLNAGAAIAAADASKLAPVDVKNAAVAHAIEYVQTHGDALLDALDLDPADEKTAAMIRARIETAIADYQQPTHEALRPMSNIDKLEAQIKAGQQA